MHRQLSETAKTPYRSAIVARWLVCATILPLPLLTGCFHTPHIIDDEDATYCETQGLIRGSDANAACAIKRETERTESGAPPAAKVHVAPQIQTPPPPAHPGGVSQTTPIFVTKGLTSTVDFLFSVKTDCSLDELPTLRIYHPPAHGTFQTVQRTNYATSAQGSLPPNCRDKKVSGIALIYTPARDYVGPDFIEFQTTTKSGQTIFKVPITVEEPAPAGAP
jgi:hypothetical protein